MNVTEKFNLITDMVDEYLMEQSNDKKTLFKQMGIQLGMTPRAIGDCFSFITNITLGEYIRLRNLAVVFLDKVENHKRWSDVVCRCGYSEDSAYHRAFKKAFGMTPAKMEKCGDYSNLMHCLSLEKIVKGNKMKIENGCIENEIIDINNLAESIENKIKKSEERDVLIELKRGISFADDCLELMGEKSCLDKIDILEAMSIMYDVDACASIYGLDLGIVFLVHELLRDKSQLYFACDNISYHYYNYSKYELWEDGNMLKCFYLTVNCGLFRQDAERLIAAHGWSFDILKELDLDYLVVCGDIRDEHKCKISEVSYDFFKKMKKWLRPKINDAMIDSFEISFFDAPLIYTEECYDKAWVKALKKIIEKISLEDLRRFDKADEITEYELNALLLVIYYYLDYTDAEAIAKNILPLIGGIDNLNSDYMKFVWYWNRDFNSLIDIQRYKQFLDIKEQEKAHGFEDDMNHIADYVINYGFSIEAAYKEYKKLLELQAIGKKYDISMTKVRFAERISNPFVEKEDAFMLLSKTYNSMNAHIPCSPILSPEEKLVIILSLNTGNSVDVCEAEVEKLFKRHSLDDEQMCEFALVNEEASHFRADKGFSLISVEDYLTVKGLVSNSILDEIWVMECLIACAIKTNKPIETVFMEKRDRMEEWIISNTK